MSSEWLHATLGEICSKQNGAIQTGPFGSQLHTSDYKEAGIPVVMPTNIGDGATACYAYEVLRLLDFKSFNAGSAVPTLNRNHVHGLPYLIPTGECIQVYESVAMPMHERAKQNELHAQTLSTLRETLLPRLISGQLRLPKAQAATEAALGSALQA